VSEFEKPELKSAGHTVTVDDVRALAGAATPHFSLQVRNRLRRLVAPLPAGDPARQLAEVEIAKLEKLAVEGERGSGESDLARITRSPGERR
jgi:hypothetical protein